MSTTNSSKLINDIETIGREVARPNASRVDQEAAFPIETIDALKKAGVLSAGIPVELGGAGMDVVELTKCCSALGQHCSSSAMILAMHYIQVASISRHMDGSQELENYLKSLVAEQRLIASVTSEVGPSGDMRSSVTHVERTGEDFELTKQATTISYGQYADDLLITARREADSAPSDQVAVLACSGDFSIETKGNWDTMGMRGTCSPGGTVRVKGKSWQVLSEPFHKIATETMVPYSHVIWGGCWLGIATDAVNRSRSMVRIKARNNPGKVPPAATDLSACVSRLQMMRNEVFHTAETYNTLVNENNIRALSSVEFALRVNNLKLSASELVVEIVTKALGVSGIMAYKNDTEFSLGRHLRDAHSAALMINNQRLHETNASLLQVYKGE